MIINNIDIQQVSLAFSILSPLYNLFGWMTRLFFDFFGNYGVAIIMLTVVVRAALIPLNISSQKAMIKSQALASKQAEIKRKYPDDKQKQNEELTKLMQENGGFGLSGCILPFLQLFFIWPIFRIVSEPLKYISRISVDNLKSMGALAFDKGLIAESLKSRISDANDIPLLKLFNQNSDFLRECIEKGFIKGNQIIDTKFLGLDLTVTPEWKPTHILADKATYLPLLIIPVLVVATSIISMRLSTVLRPDYKEKKIAKAREKKNAAMSGQTMSSMDSQSELTMKFMNWGMPILMLVTTFSMPAAMGLYWTIGGVMGIITQYVVYFLFTKPFELKKKEYAELKKTAFHKNTQDKNLETKDNKKSKKKK